MRVNCEAAEDMKILNRNSQGSPRGSNFQIIASSTLNQKQKSRDTPTLHDPTPK